MRYLLLALLVTSFFFNACKEDPVDPPDMNQNPGDTTNMPVDTTMMVLECTKNLSEPGFDAAGSDARAIEIADSMMMALGGRCEWDKARYFGFTFTNINTWIWDRYTGRVRHEQGNNVRLVDIDDLTGTVFNNGTEVTDPTDKADQLEDSRDEFLNDSYWLFMPFKLKDNGVILKYLGEETKNGIDAYVLQLTFMNVGLTPDNKYILFVDKSNYLLFQREYYANFNDPNPSINSPWEDYAQYGYVKLATDRGFVPTFSNVKAYEGLPDAVFEDLSLPNLSSFEL